MRSDAAARDRARAGRARRGTLKDTEFLDVGANIGTTTVSALLHGPFASAICFEPERQNLVDLRLNLLLNGLEDRATAIGVALSDQSGRPSSSPIPGAAAQAGSPPTTRASSGWAPTMRLLRFAR